MQLTLFDIVAIVIVALSAIVALTRGAVREVLGLASWLGAAVAAFLLLPYAAPLVRPIVAGDALAKGVAAVAVFVVALVVLKLLSGMVVRAIEGSAVGTLDKLGGLAFGLARGAFVVCAAYLVGSYLIKPDQQPEWVRQAYLLPPIQDGARRIEQLLPVAYRPGSPGSPAPSTDGQSYTDAQRQALDKLVTPQP